jgi:hypothetical protein
LNRLGESVCARIVFGMQRKAVRVSGRRDKRLGSAERRNFIVA